MFEDISWYIWQHHYQNRFNWQQMVESLDFWVLLCYLENFLQPQHKGRIPRTISMSKQWPIKYVIHFEWFHPGLQIWVVVFDYLFYILISATQQNIKRFFFRLKGSPHFLYYMKENLRNTWYLLCKNNSSS